MSVKSSCPTANLRGLKNIPHHPTALIILQWVRRDRCLVSQATFVTVRLHGRLNILKKKTKKKLTVTLYAVT